MKYQIAQSRISSVILLIYIVIGTSFAHAQFTSVTNGKWTSPQTWSTNPNATAIPDSNSLVVINHIVEVSGNITLAYCYDLVINTSGTLTSYMNNESKTLYVKNSLTNYGLIRPIYGLMLTVRESLINLGTINTIGANDDNFHLILYGSIHNHGSFRGLKSTTFRGGGNQTHTHHLRSWNDSTVYLGNASVADQLGVIVIDSIFTLGAASAGLQGLFLNASVLNLPIPVYGKTNLRLNGAYVYGGTITANDQIISTIEGKQGFLGYIYSNGSVLNTIIQNAELQGYFSIGGEAGPDLSSDSVIFEGFCELHGHMRDWYTGSGSFQNMRTAVIKGEFLNHGNLFDATTDNALGLKILLYDSSFFHNEGSMEQRCLSVVGSAHFSTSDTLKIRELRAENENCKLYILSNFYLKARFQTASDGLYFFNSHIHLVEGNSFTVHNPSYTALSSHVYIHANGAVVDLSYVKDFVVIENATIKRLGIRTENETGLLLTGNTTVAENGSIYNVWNNYGTVRTLGSFVNFGTIKNNSAGNLRIFLTKDATHNGTEWSNFLTTLAGSTNQTYTIPESHTTTGQFVLDASVEGTSYQWYKDNQLIAGATGKLLYFYTGLNSSHKGTYNCLVNGTISRNIIINNESNIQVTLVQEGFDESFPPNGWQILSTNTAYTWLQANSTNHNFNTIDPLSQYSALCPWVAQNQDEWLISPMFNLGPGNASVEFWAGYSTNWLASATLKLHIRQNNTKNWTQIWEAQNDGQTWKWRQQTVDISSYANLQHLQVAWQYVGNDGDLAGIDNVRIEGYPFPSSLSDQNINSFADVVCYPNPFSDQITIRITNSMNNELIMSIYDLSGKLYMQQQKLLTSSGESHDLTLNTADYITNEGVYFLRIQNKSQQKYLKLIKGK